MNPYLYVVAVACVMNAACAGGILARDPERRASQLAAVVLFGGSFWAACELAWNLSASAETAVALMRAGTLGWLFIGPLALHMILDATSSDDRRLWRLLPPLYALSGVFLVLSLATPWTIERAVPTAWGFALDTGPVYAAVYVVTMATAVLAAGLVARALSRMGSPAERRQRPWILGGYAVCFTGSFFTDLLLPLAGLPFPRPGPVYLALLGGIAVWNVLRFGYQSLLTPGGFAEDILATLPDGVALVQADGRIRTANPGLARLSGRPLETLRGLPVRELLGDWTEAAVGPDGVRECRLARPDGTLLPVGVAASKLTDRQGHAIGEVLVLRDLREISELRQRVVRSSRLAAVGELAAGVAHEINNPISFVRANLTQLRRDWEEIGATLGPKPGEELEAALDEGNELIEESLEGVDRTVEIVRGVKGFAHRGSGAREYVSLNRLLEEVLHMTGGHFRGRAIQIQRDYSEVPLLHCSPQDLKQVFLQLIVNASDAIGDEGTLRIATESLGDRVCVRVDDDGCGIPPEHLDRIFDPFFTTKGALGGTGLGLGTAHQIVESHDGEIVIDSSPGAGTRVRVSLPVRVD